MAQALDIARLEPVELKEKANLGYRAERLVKAARYLVEHPMSLRALHGRPEAEAIKNVMKIPGIGKYSVGLIIGRSSVPIDVWSVVIMSELLFGRALVNPRQDINAVTRAVRERWANGHGWRSHTLNDLPKLANMYALSRLT